MALVGLELESDYLLTGRDGHCTLDVLAAGEKQPTVLSLRWHKMEVSGRWEVTSYLELRAAIGLRPGVRSLKWAA